MTAATDDSASDLRELAQRIHAGEVRAETELVARYLRAAHAIARRHCRPQESSVDDIVQDVLTEVLARLRRGAIADPRALPQYLQVSIRNACTAHYRRVTRLHAVESLAGMGVPADPAELEMHQERARMLRVLVAELPVARDRELLRRFYLLEQSREEVCGALGIEEDHFRRVVHRARQRLREALNRSNSDAL